MNERDGIALLWVLFASFLAAPLFLLVLLLVLPLDDRPPTIDAAPAWAASILAAALMLALVRWAAGRALDASSADALAASFRANFVLGMAFSEAAALVAFAAALLSGDVRVYALGLVASLLGFASSAPTAGRIATRQQQLLASGSPLVLLDALRGGAP